MIQKIVEQIIHKQVKNNVIASEEVSIYRYGYILMGEVVLNVFLSLVIGTVFKKLNMVLFFLCMYIPLRSFCGGWHADKIWKCTVISNIILVLECIGVRYVAHFLTIGMSLVMFVMSIVVIICTAPLETNTKKIGKSERKFYKKKIYLIIVLHVIVMVAMMKLEMQNFIFAMLYVYLVQVIMLLAQKIRCIF